MNSSQSSRFLALGICSLIALASAQALHAEDKAPLVPGTTIEIPGSQGKFDFLEIDPVKHRLLASHEKDATADIFDLKTNKLLGRVEVGEAMEIAVDQKTGKYFVSINDKQKVAIVDPTSLKEVNSIPLTGPLDGIIIDPKNRHLFAAHDDGTELWVIDAETEKLIGTVTIPGAPEYMVYDSATDRIYLNIKVTDEVVVIDPESNKVIAHIPTAPAKKPHGLAIDSASGRLFSAGANGELAVIDIKSGKVISSVKIASGVDQIAIDSELRRIYCASGNATLSVVQETADGAVLVGNVKTATGAKSVAVDPQTHAVWLTYTDGKSAFAKSWVAP